MVESSKGRIVEDRRTAAGRSKVQSFEDLRIFQQARELAKRVYSLTKTGAIAKDFRLVDQMRASAISILSNIAEGFERQTDAEFRRGLYYAKGSCGELRAQTIAAFDQNYFSKEAFDEIRVDCMKLSGSIANLISYLDRSDKAVARK
jgi:four helix bundle protein